MKVYLWDNQGSKVITDNHPHKYCCSHFYHTSADVFEYLVDRAEFLEEDSLKRKVWVIVL